MGFRKDKRFLLTKSSTELDWLSVLTMTSKKHKPIDISTLWLVSFLSNLSWSSFDKHLYPHFRYMIFTYSVFIYFTLLRMWEIVPVSKFLRIFENFRRLVSTM